jgi:FkbM family methyltransferase
MFGNRSISQILRAFCGKHHYVALLNMFRIYPNFVENLHRYLSGFGQYPAKILVRTPIGVHGPELFCHDDLLTLNEIFCRLDYFADSSVKVIVDIGSNIGISGLYFLTRNTYSRCYLYEPDPRNIEKLFKTLKGYESRYTLSENAVSDQSETLDFGIESTGRYGGLTYKSDETIQVDCININEALSTVLSKEGHIDILKIDTEGVEIPTVKAIDPSFANRIKRIYIEARPKADLLPHHFSQHQYGTVCQFTNNKFSSIGP